MLREIVGQRASKHLAFTIFLRLNVWCVFHRNMCITIKILFHYAQVLWRVGSSVYMSVDTKMKMEEQKQKETVLTFRVKATLFQ